MPDHEDTYQREVIRARFELRGVPPEEDWDDLTDLEREVAAEMTQEGAVTGIAEEGLAQVDIAHVVLLGSVLESFPDEPLTPERIQQVERATRQSFGQYSVQIEQILSSTRSRSTEKMVRAHQVGYNQAGAQVGLEVSDDVIVGMIDRIKARMEGRRPIEEGALQVVRRRTTQANEATVSWIRGQEGRPGRQAAREWVDRMSDHPRIRQAIENAGPRGRNVRRAIERVGRAAEDLQDDAVNLYTNAKRAYVHETNTALHEADVLAAEESPAIKTLRWRVSARHPTIESSPDVCDVLEDMDLHGFGKGLYHPGSTPTLLHPFCQCAVIPNTAPPNEWGEIEYSDDKPPNAKPKQIGQSEVRSVLVENVTASSGDVTQAKVRRSTRVANRQVQVAYDRWIDF